MCNSNKKKISSILGYTLTGDLPGTTTFPQNGNNWESPFFLLLFYLFSSAPIPVAGVTLCVFWSVIQQPPVEIAFWAVLVYILRKAISVTGRRGL
jgi:hypothetical protein